MVANDTLTRNRLGATLVPAAEGDNRAMREASGALTAAVATTVEVALVDFIAAEIAALEAIDPALAGFARTARDCVLSGGKRLRPTFAYWGWRGAAGGDEPLAPAVPAFAALELLHTFALVHDDVMDRSATRRGRPTAHRILADQHRAAERRGDADRFGEAAAVLVGDLCLVWADRLLGTAALPVATLFDVRRCYDQMRIEAVAGQYLDILGENDPVNWSVDRALRVARHKTASYTVQYPLLLGAALADRGRDAALTDAYSRYGVAVGEAFQLCDDLLGVYGDPAATGKPAGDDLRTGKPTVLLVLARELATTAERAELDRGMAAEADGGHAIHDEGVVARLADVVAATGAVARVEEMIGRRVSDALAALETAPIDRLARSALADLALAATRRRA